MQGQQHVLPVRVEQHRGRGEVPGGAGPGTSVLPRGEKAQERLAQCLLRGCRGPPLVQSGQGFRVQAHSSSSPSVAGPRGGGVLAACPTATPPSGCQSAGNPSTFRTTSAAKMVDPIQHDPSPSAASATSRPCTAAPPATVNIV